jgi:hypothetical protein
MVVWHTAGPCNCVQGMAKLLKTIKHVPKLD